MNFTYCTPFVAGFTLSCGSAIWTRSMLLKNEAVVIVEMNLLRHIIESKQLISPQTPWESPSTVLHFWQWRVIGCLASETRVSWPELRIKSLPSNSILEIEALPPGANSIFIWWRNVFLCWRWRGTTLGHQVHYCHLVVQWRTYNWRWFLSFFTHFFLLMGVAFPRDSRDQPNGMVPLRFEFSTVGARSPRITPQWVWTQKSSAE